MTRFPEVKLLFENFPICPNCYSDWDFSSESNMLPNYLFCHSCFLGCRITALNEFKKNPNLKSNKILVAYKFYKLINPIPDFDKILNLLIFSRNNCDYFVWIYHYYSSLKFFKCKAHSVRDDIDRCIDINRPLSFNSSIEKFNALMKFMVVK